MERMITENKIRRTWNKNFLNFLSVVWCALFFALIVARDILDANVHFLILTGVLACAMFFSSYENAVAFFCMIIPMTNGLKAAAIYPVAVMILLVRRKNAFSPLQFIFPLVFIAYEYLLSHTDPKVEYYHLVYFSAAILLFAYFMFDRQSGIDYKKALSGYIVGTAFFAAIILILSLKSYTILDFFRTTARFGDLPGYAADRDIMRDNQNNVAYFCLTAVACYIPLLHSSMKWIYKIFMALPTLFCFFCGLLTISRAFVLIFAVVAAYYVLIHLRFDRKSFFVLCGVALVAFVGFSLLERYPFVAQRFFDRFGESNVTIDDGRMQIIRLYNEFMWENDGRFFFGTGALAVESVTGIRSALHNGTQQIFVSYGLIGFILFVFPLVSAFISVNRPKIAPLVYFVPLLAVLGFTQTIQFIAPSVLMLPMCLAVFALKLGQEERMMRNREVHRSDDEDEYDD